MDYCEKSLLLFTRLIFDPYPPFSRSAAGSGFFDSKTSKLLRCWTRYYAGARSQYLARARGAHRAGRADRGGQGGGGLLLAAVQGIRAGDRERWRSAVCCSSGGLHPHRGHAEVCPGRSDPQRGGMIQHSEGGAASWAGLAVIRSTVPRFTECRRGTFHGAAGRYFSPLPEGSDSTPNGISPHR